MKKSIFALEFTVRVRTLHSCVSATPELTSLTLYRYLYMSIPLALNFGTHIFFPAFKGQHDKNVGDQGSKTNDILLLGQLRSASKVQNLFWVMWLFYGNPNERCYFFKSMIKGYRSYTMHVYTQRTISPEWKNRVKTNQRTTGIPWVFIFFWQILT